MSTEQLEERVRVLETLITALAQKTSDGERLADGVERLAAETGGLNSILQKVDDQQQRLSTLGRDLERVEKSKASKDDLETAKLDQQEQAWEFRKAALKRIYSTALGIVVALGLLGGILYEYEESKAEAAYEVCVARNEQNMAILQILRETVAANPSGPAASPLTDGIERLEDLIIDCEDLK